MEDVTNTSVLTTIFLNNLEDITTDMTRLINNGSTTTGGSYTESSTSYNNDTTQSSLGILKEVTSQATLNKSTKSCTTTTTEEPFDEFGPPEGVEYIFVPLGVMIFVIILSAVVLIISRRRKLERLRHRLMPLYNFDPGEEGEDDWETELLDEGIGSRQRRN
ncbi:uncharacterized protein C3orf18-like isoform X2 [Chelonus insularis]|uniref:uncharacterized protein C3orf18-like isoform X2 n=1 Tax=Chelonus insularis TaxID=460826 RepID=UPI00158E0290|nr:uncharacterized protein C3orf18-like isoform X2 [Chelonus insularis]